MRYFLLRDEVESEQTVMLEVIFNKRDPAPVENERLLSLYDSGAISNQIVEVSAKGKPLDAGGDK